MLKNLTFLHGVLLMGVLASLLFIKSCNTEHKYNIEVQKVMDYKDTVKIYAAKDGTIINYNNVLETNLEVLVNTVDSMKTFLENIKIPNPEVITVIREVFYVDSIPSVSLNIADCEFDTTFFIDNAFYTIKGRVTNKALNLSSIRIPNKMSLVIGNRRESWWKKKEYIATVTNSNPYINNEGIQSFVLSSEKRWNISPSIGYGFYYDPWKGNVGHGIIGGISINFKLKP